MQVHHREVIGVGLVPREVERRFLGGLGAADERARFVQQGKVLGRQLAEGDARGRGEDAPLDPQAHVSGGTAG